jgi:hypothetical protein
VRQEALDGSSRGGTKKIGVAFYSAAPGQAIVHVSGRLISGGANPWLNV